MQKLVLHATDLLTGPSGLGNNIAGYIVLLVNAVAGSLYNRVANNLFQVQMAQGTISLGTPGHS